MLILEYEEDKAADRTAKLRIKIARREEDQRQKANVYGLGKRGEGLIEKRGKRKGNPGSKKAPFELDQDRGLSA